MTKKIENINNLPELYSQSAILTFSLFLTPIYGSILSAINLDILKKKKKSIIVICFGVLFTFLINIIVVLVDNNYNFKYKSISLILFYYLGGIIINKFFNNKHMPSVYYDKKYLVPILIGIILFSLSIFFEIKQGLIL